MTAPTTTAPTQSDDGDQREPRDILREWTYSPDRMPSDRIPATPELLSRKRAVWLYVREHGPTGFLTIRDHVDHATYVPPVAWLLNEMVTDCDLLEVPGGYVVHPVTDD